MPAGVRVEARSGHFVTRASAPGGRFRFELSPGEYELQVFQVGTAAGPATDAVVKRGETTQVTLRFDTGVR
jgi:hypothetical protein